MRGIETMPFFVVCGSAALQQSISTQAQILIQVLLNNYRVSLLSNKRNFRRRGNGERIIIYGVKLFRICSLFLCYSVEQQQYIYNILPKLKWFTGTVMIAAGQAPTIYCKIILYFQYLGQPIFVKMRQVSSRAFFILFRVMFYFHLECHVAFKYDVVILLNDVPLPHTNMLKNVDEKFRENI